MKPVILVLLLTLATPCAAQMPPQFGPADPRLQTLQYDPDQIVRLRVANGFQVSVLFSPEEQVENVAVGDSDAWQVTLNGRGDAVFIKPVGALGPTNMTVITTARVYIFELSPAQGPGPDTPFTIRFRYPPLASHAQPGQASIPAIGTYRVSGSRSLRPAAISDDGVRTSIQWPPGRSLPAVFAVDDQGKEVLVDGYMRNGKYEIDSVFSALVFRLDRQTARASRSVGSVG